jgi:hypothetical protein
MTPRDGIKAQDQYINDLTGALKQDLDTILHQVELEIAADIQQSLIFEDGLAPATVTNRRQLRRIANKIEKLLERKGSAIIIDEFIAGFDRSLDYFDQILETISDQIKIPLKATRTAADLTALEGIKEAARQSLGASLDVMVAQAKRNLLFRVGALNFRDTVKIISKTFNRGIAESETIAATSMTMYMRTNSDATYRRIEKAFKGVRYRYDGPDDKLTRPFCDALMARSDKKPLSRKEIDALDNGQLPNVFITCGGWNCRHSFILDLKPLDPKKSRL